MARKYDYKSLYNLYIKEYNKGMEGKKTDDKLSKPQSFNSFKVKFNNVKSSKSYRLSGKKITQIVAKQEIHYKLDYITQYNKSAEKVGTAAESAQTLDQFMLNFNDIKKEIKKSKSHRLSGKQIAQKMARGDVYEKTSKQAKAIKEALERHGFESPSLSAIRAGRVPQEFWDFVKDEKTAALQRGLTNKQVNLYISTYIFGSE